MREFFFFVCFLCFFLGRSSGFFQFQVANLEFCCCRTFDIFRTNLLAEDKIIFSFFFLAFYFPSTGYRWLFYVV